MKRDNWTNDEVIGILEDLLIEKNGVWNNDRRRVCRAALLAISQFEDFKRPVDEYAAMAYDTEKKEIVVVGPPLPR